MCSQSILNIVPSFLTDIYFIVFIKIYVLYVLLRYATDKINSVNM
jgi:hypothetical protein